MTLQPGTRLGHYEITSLLGSGGMGEVYRTRDHKLGRDVAVKVLREELASDPERLRRFEQEARSASALNHPNIITIYDIGKHGETPYIAMEFVEGRTVREVLSEGPLPTKKLLQLASQIAEGLAKAHSAGIVHRDLKPENLMVTSDGYVKILDFGLAKLMPEAVDYGSEEATVARELTRAGVILGTASYMSPEQALGKPLDARTDVFSLGAVLYEMATGSRPFQGETPAGIFNEILNKTPTPPFSLNLELPRDFDGFIKKALEKDTAQRHQTAVDLLQHLKSVMEPVPTQTSPQPSIAVLPFANMSADPEQEYFCDGMAEEIINALTRIEDIRVVARTSAFFFKGKDIDIREIGRKLNANKILEGSVRKSGSRLRITAQLINVEDGYHIWSERFDRNLSDVFDLQDEISLAIVENLKIKLSSKEKAALIKQPIEDLEAYNWYLKGRFHISQFTEVSFNNAIDCFKEAIKREPSFALAHAGVAESYVWLCMGVGIQPPSDSMREAKKAALKAVELGPDLAEVHTSLANVATYFDWDHVIARRSFQRAIDLNPNSADILMWYAGYLLIFEHEFEEGLGMLERARELNPLQFLIYNILGWAYCFIPQFDTLILETKKALSLDPSFAYGPHLLGEAYVGKGLYREAIASYEEAIRRMGRSTTNIAELGYAHALAGNTDEATELLRDVEERAYRSNMYYGYVGLIYVGLGDNDKAFEWFEKACDEHDSIFLFIPSIQWPKLVDFCKDARFEELLKRLGLAHLARKT